MVVRPGYKQTDVGVIPEDWDVRSFGRLLGFSNGINADKGAYGIGCRFVNVLEPITYSHLHGPEIPGRVAIPHSVATIYAVKKGDVLFNRTSETDNEVGLAATYLGNEHVVFGGFVIRGRPLDDSLDPTYSGYALRAPAIRSQIIPMGQGAIRANIGQNNLKLVVTPIPPKAEQLAIAAALSDIDALLGGLERIIAKKRDLKQAAMQQLLTGQTRLPGFSGEWDVKRLGDMGATYGGLTGKTKADFGEGAARYITFMNVITNVVIDCGIFDCVNVSAVESQNRAKKGDLLFNGSSETPEEVAMCAVLLEDVQDVYVNSFCFGFRFGEEAEADGVFFAYYLRSKEGRELMKSLAQGSTRYNLSKVALLNSPLRLPTLPEQTAIATILSDMDAELSALETRRDKTRALKQGMMQELLTGRVRLISGELKVGSGE